MVGEYGLLDRSVQSMGLHMVIPINKVTKAATNLNLKQIEYCKKCVKVEGREQQPPQENARVRIKDRIYGLNKRDCIFGY